ncbi:MAG TPA: glycosyltransferase family 4 protein [Gaiellaceae bacterium]|nr:glycosyltransferase family 4 protein [Gaiellaceae bacterium]
MKVAYFSPLPPSTSGIADYSALLLPALEARVEVEVVRPGRTRPVADADVALYHVGNDPDAHGWIVDALRRREGVVVLHDFVIHHLVAGMTIGRNDGHAYLAAMEREAGVAGRMLGWGVLEGRVPPLWEVRPTEFPLVGEVLDLASGIIVHSHYVETHVREHGYDGPLWRIPHPAWPVRDVEPAGVGGSPLFGCFGHLNESKRIPQLLRAFARFRETHPGARLLLVGAEAPGFDLAGRLERLGLDDTGVVREPYVEEHRLWSLLAACDACVLLRAPTMGETSGSAIRTLALGKPLVVNDLGWFSELPDDVALKVPAGGDDEIDEIAAALGHLAEPGVAAEMGDAAARYVRREHDLDAVAERYVAALEVAAGGAAVEVKVGLAVAAAAADAGLRPEAVAPELQQLGFFGRNGHVPVTDVRPARAHPVRAVPMWAWLGGLYALSAAVLLVLARRVVSPWIMSDELVYSDMARSFAATGRFLIQDVSANYGVVYPLLVAPAYGLFDTVLAAYRATHVVNVVLMPTVVFPVYLLARRVVRPGYALAAAALAVVVPSMIYTGTIMTENAFYPVSAWFALALVLALEQPTLRRQLVLLAVCVVAFLTRAQAVALVAAVVTAPIVLAWIERGRPRRLSAWKATYAILGAAAVAVVVFELARGKSPSDLLGGYSVTTTASTYALWPALRWIAFHVAALDLSLFVVPFAALVVLVANARHLDARLRAFAAAAVTVSFWLTIQVGVFASSWSNRIEERNLFYLSPFFLIALLAWLERGQPRPPRATIAAAGIAAALPGILPLASLMNINAESDTLFLQPWWYLADRVTGRDSIMLVVMVVAIALASLFVWLPGRYAPLLPVLVALGFAVTWLPLQLWVHSFPRLSAFAYANGVGSAGRSWIDHVVGRDADVTLVWSGDNPYRGWENEFWNRSVRRVYDLGDSALMNRSVEPLLTFDTATGRLLNGRRAIRTQYVLAEPSARVVGTPIAGDSEKGLVLYRVNGVLRTSIRISGWHGDHWTAPTVVWRDERCAGGTLSIPMRSDAGLYAGVTQRVTVTGMGTARRVVTLAPGASRTVSVPLRPAGGACTIRLSVTPTRRPTDVPALHSSDRRRLGVIVDSFDYSTTPGS